MGVSLDGQKQYESYCVYRLVLYMFTLLVGVSMQCKCDMEVLSMEHGLQRNFLKPNLCQFERKHAGKKK